VRRGAGKIGNAGIKIKGDEIRKNASVENNTACQQVICIIHFWANWASFIHWERLI